MLFFAIGVLLGMMIMFAAVMAWLTYMGVL